MPNIHTTLTSLFSDIADAIREKTGDTAQIVADDFPSEIANIQTGSGGTTVYQAALNLDGEVIPAGTYTNPGHLQLGWSDFTWITSDPISDAIFYVQDKNTRLANVVGYYWYSDGWISFYNFSGRDIELSYSSQIFCIDTGAYA